MRHCQTSFKLVTESRTSVADILRVIDVVVVVGDVDDADTAASNVAHDLIFLVKTVFTDGQFMSVDVTSAVTPPQADHRFTSFVAGLEAARGQTGDGDGQSQRTTATQKSLSCCFLLHCLPTVSPLSQLAELLPTVETVCICTCHVGKSNWMVISSLIRNH